jgi:NAD(P)-dependent dehydrogenase (short-subunit alcohol dehydrogenase family)
VKSFATQGYQIAILDISETSAKSVLSTLPQDFPSIHFIFGRCDVSKWEDQKAAFEMTLREFEHIDVVIANAGISEKGNFLDIDTGEPVKPTFATLDVNMTGMLYSKPTSIIMSTANL